MEIVDKVVQNRRLGLDVNLNHLLPPNLITHKVSREDHDSLRTRLEREDLLPDILEVCARRLGRFGVGKEEVYTGVADEVERVGVGRGVEVDGGHCGGGEVRDGCG